MNREDITENLVGKIVTVFLANNDNITGYCSELIGDEIYLDPEYTDTIALKVSDIEDYDVLKDDERTELENEIAALQSNIAQYTKNIEYNQKALKNIQKRIDELESKLKALPNDQTDSRDA